MKRLLLIGPAAVAIYVVARQLLGGGPTFHFLVLGAATLWAAGANVAAGRAFAEGDYLRRAWFTNALSFAVLAVLGGADATAEPVRSWLRVGLAVPATSIGVWALWIFGRALRAAGLGEVVSARQRRVGYAIGILVALAIVGLPAVRGAAAVARGSVAALTMLISSLGDIGGCIAVVPVVLMARALRGGLLVWVSGFLAASEVAWLLLDAQSTVSDLVGTDFGERWFDAWAVAACALSVAAALAQRRVIDVEKRASAAGPA